MVSGAIRKVIEERILRPIDAARWDGKPRRADQPRLLGDLLNFGVREWFSSLSDRASGEPGSTRPARETPKNPHAPRRHLRKSPLHRPRPRLANRGKSGWLFQMGVTTAFRLPTDGACTGFSIC